MIGNAGNSNMANYITIIGHSLLQPICTLLEKLLDLPVEDDEEASKHPDERGYSISISLLLAVMTESVIMRARYLNSSMPSSSEKSIQKFLAARYPGLPHSGELIEIFILRDAIAHNHLWRIESASNINI